MSARPRTTLIDGGHIVTMDSAGTEYPDGYVFIRGGVIDAVGASADAPTDVDERVDAHGTVVIPGLVNTHQHLWYNLLKCLSDGLLLETRGRVLSRPATAVLTPGDLEVGAYLSALEMLSSGTTTFINHSVTDTTDEEVEKQIRPVRDLGMRQVFAKELRPRPSVEASIAAAEATYETWHNSAGGRVTTAIVIESTAHWIAAGNSSEELIVRGNEFAESKNLRITAHIGGGTMARDMGYLKYVIETGRTEVEYLERLGVLDSRWILAHCINSTPRDIELIASRGAHVSHTPSAEASRGGGITPIRQMLDHGVSVSLGTDGSNVDTSVDMNEQMKLTLLLQNQLAGREALDARRMIRMATIRGAEALGLQDSIGSLEVGKQADMAIFGLDRPDLAIDHDPVTLVVHSMKGRDVRHVLIDGNFAVRDGRITALSTDQIDGILTDATARAHDLVERAGIVSPRWVAATSG